MVAPKPLGVITLSFAGRNNGSLVPAQRSKVLPLWNPTRGHLIIRNLFHNMCRAVLAATPFSRVLN